MNVDYENPWLYKNTTFSSDDIGDFFGFVYRITNLQTGKKYIGRKYFYQFRKPRGKSRKVKSESDWKKYDEYAEKWSPYKTIASLHLWKTVD